MPLKIDTIPPVDHLAPLRFLRLQLRLKDSQVEVDVHILLPFPPFHMHVHVNARGIEPFDRRVDHDLAKKSTDRR